MNLHPESGMTVEPRPIPQLEQLPQEQRKALNALDPIYVRQNPDSSIMFMTELLGEKLRINPRSLGKTNTDPALGDNKWPLTVWHATKGIRGLSFEDHNAVERGEDIKPKALVYSPETAEDALEIGKIRAADFYMGLWEIGDTRVLPEEYPTVREGNQSGVSTHEAIAAAIMYHPRYGAGQREEDGKLYVNFKDATGNLVRKPINRDFFRSWGYRGAPDVKAGGKSSLLESSPAKFFIKNCPNLIDKGLIDPHQDFRVLGAGSDIGHQWRKIRHKGLMSIEGRKYNLGTQYEGGNYAVYQISPHYAAVLHIEDTSKPRIEKIFKLHTDELSTEERAKPTASRNIIKRGDIEWFNPTDIEGLSGEDGILVTHFQDFLNFSHLTVREGQFTLFDLTFKEKALATALFQDHKDDLRFHRFIRQYGMDGLRSLMATQDASLNVNRLFDIGEQMPAEAVFSDVSDIVKTVTKYRESIRKTLSEDEQQEADEVAHTVMGFTSNLMMTLIPVLEKNPTVKGKLSLSDVTTTLQGFRKKVQEMYAHKYGMENTDKTYQKILDVYKGEGDNPDVDQVALSMLSDIWRKESDKQNSDVIKNIYDANNNFYTDHADLFVSASETTGDTKEELKRFREDYLPQFLIRRELLGKNGSFQVLDMGCGEGSRITLPMAETLPDSASLVGIDLVKYPEWERENLPGNLRFMQGSFTDIALPDNSISLATAHWSVFNDLTSRKLQLESLSELTRVLEIGGEFYLDVPYLEGGEGSWEKAAQDFHRTHPDQPYGKIQADFPGGRNKEFAIYPEKELNALLDHAGFSILDSNVWRTEAGKPRRTIVARLDRKITPQRLAA